MTTAIGELAPPEARSLRLSAQHISALDGIRGIAVLSVILWHALPQVQSKTLLAKFFRAPLLIGWSGVELFFVLSGFLITGILLDTRDSANYFRSFYARRALRVFPLYYAALTVILTASHYFPYLNKSLPLAHDRLFYFVYLNNWWPLLKDTWHGNIIGHFWSLAVEEQFYLLWPFCVFVIRPKYLAPVTLAGIAGAAVIRCLLYANSGVTRNMTENTFTRMDTLLAGAFLAILVRNAHTLRRVTSYIYFVGIVSGIAMLIVVYLFKNPPVMSMFDSSLLGFSYSALLLYAVLGSGSSSRIQQLFCSKTLTTVGKYSYGMYVLHVPILFVASLLIGRRIYYRENLMLSILFMGLVIASTFGAAKLSFDLFESRFLRLKKYFRA